MSLRTPSSFVLLVVCGLIGLALAFGFLGRFHPAFDSFSHFRLHLAGLLALGGFALLALRFRREGLAALSLAACSVIVTPGALPGLAGSRAAIANEAPADSPTYRLLHLNARYDNSAPEEFLSLIAHARPDVVTVSEVSAMWRGRLESLAAAYPYRIFCDPRGPIGGVAILSRRPFARVAAPACVAKNTMAIAGIDFGGRAVTVAALHLYWPWPFEQPRQVADIAGELSRLPGEAILAGDFNAVRWSQSLARIAEAGRLRDAGPVGPTWLPRGCPDAMRRWVGIGIDHVLAGDAVEIANVERARDVASDHLPVMVDFWLPAEVVPPAGGTVALLTASPGA